MCLFLPVSHCFDYCIFVVQSEVRKHDPSSPVLLSLDHFSYLVSFVFPYKFLNYLLQFCEKHLFKKKIFFHHTHGMQKFWGQRQKPCHNSDPSHSNNNTGSLTCCTRELQERQFIKIGIALNLYVGCLGKYDHFNSINSSNPRT